MDIFDKKSDQAVLPRQNEEEKVNNKNKKPDKGFVETGALKLLHILQACEEELALENEELRQANVKSEVVAGRYTKLYAFAQLGYYTIDSEGMIIDLNYTGAEILGEKRFSLLNINLSLFVSESFKNVFTEFMKKVNSGMVSESCELTLGYDDMVLCQVYMEGISAGENQNCLLSVVNVSSFI